MSLDPHPWLGKTFLDLLESFRTSQGGLYMTVSRPSVFSVGQGQLRVASVRKEELGTRVIFVYERYLSTAKPRSAKRSQRSKPTEPPKAESQAP